MKLCRTCETLKAFTDFHKDKAKADGLHTQCKPCRRLDYDKNRRKRLEYNGKWNAANRDLIKKKNQEKLLSVEGRAKQLWLAARNRAAKKNLRFDICLPRVTVALLLGTCERTGIKFDLSPPIKSKINPFSPSIDKIDPYGDYTDNNIKVVCTAYNFAKNQMSDAEFLEFCRKVVEFNK